MIDSLIKDPAIKQALNFLVLTLSVSAYYSLFKYSRKILSLFIEPTEQLTDKEQLRLDRLLESGKRFHNSSFILAGVLLALSSLSGFDKFAAPFGDIVFPKLQAAIGLFILCIISLVVSDRYFLMAYPWMKIDNRRPPFDWIAMGLHFEKSLFSGFIFYLPLPIASIGATIILATDASLSNIANFSVLSMTGFGLLYLPRTIYYWNHLIEVREDHRGGAVTLSVYLLYWYRMLRQILYSIYIILPIVIAVPQWQSSQFATTVLYLTFAFGIAYIVRMIFSMRFIYRNIDKLGLKFGFPIASRHYK